MEKLETKKPRRYLRSRITRKLILDAGLGLFLAEGYKKTTITKISNQANVGYGTVYSHFKGKDDILACILDQLLHEFFVLLQIPFSPFSYQVSWDIYHDVIETAFRLAEQHRPMMKVLLEALDQSETITGYWNSMKDNFVNSICRAIDKALQYGYARPDIDPQKAAKASVFLVERFLWEVVQGKEKEIEYLSIFLTDLIYQGLFIKPTLKA